MNTWPEIFVEAAENVSASPILHAGKVQMFPGAKVTNSRFRGPALLNRRVKVGPEVDAGRYLAMADYSSILRATIGNFCTIGMRTAINPFSHPSSWLSIHEFQYHAFAFDFVEEYRQMQRLPRSAAGAERSTIGNDVWMGHNAVILSGVTVGDGAIIGAGAIVTKDVAPYAVVVGVPAKVVKYRFDEAIIARQLRLKWWELELEQLSGLPFNDVERALDGVEQIRAEQASRAGGDAEETTAK